MPKRRPVISLVIALTIAFATTLSYAQSSTFTYQGKLTDAGATANGIYLLQFSLFDSATNGNQIGQTQRFDGTQFPAVQVINGVFTVQLNFGSPTPPFDNIPRFDGSPRWLQIAVEGLGQINFQNLSPRQPITSEPYSIRSASAAAADAATNALTAVNALSLGGVGASQYVVTTDARLSDARPPVGGSSNYIQNGSSVQSADLNISGNAGVGGGITAGNFAMPNGTIGGTPMFSGLSTEGQLPLVNFGLNSGREAPFNPNAAGFFLRADIRVGSPGFYFYKKTLSSDVQLVSISSAAQMTIGSAGTPGGLTVAGSTQVNDLYVSALGTGGTASLCRNPSNNQISSCSSSTRYKKNIRGFSSGLGLIDKLRPVSFNWKATDEADVGLVAEEVAKASSLFVTRNAAGEIEGVKYDRLSVAFVNAFKEQQAQIDRQQKEIDDLKGIVSKLQVRRRVRKVSRKGLK